MRALILISVLGAVIIHFQEVDSSELRFCYKGWQRYRQSDCPYGLLFKSPIDLECYYSFGENTPNLYDDVCTEPYTIEQKMAPEKGLPMVHNLAKILLIDYMNKSVQPKPVKDWVDLTPCYQECSNSEEDTEFNSHEIDSAEIREDEDRVIVISEESKKRIADQTLRLGDYLFDKIYTLSLTDLADTANSTGPEVRLLEMFKKTMLIMSKTCKHPFLHLDYINRVYHGFMFLIKDMGMQTIQDVSVEEFEDIMEALDLCEQKGQVFRLEGSVCPSRATVKEIVVINDLGEEMSASVVINNPETQFELAKYDLFIESAWRSIDSVHGMCFTTFRPNSNMHHRYQRAMEMLFNEKMQERWINPTELEDIKDWGSWFLVDIQTTMDNLQHCVRGAYEGAPFSVRLDRPIDHKRVRRDLSRTSNTLQRRRRESSPEDSNNQIPFQDPFAERWNKYERDGGITVKLGQNIQCLKTESERTATLSNMRLACGDEISASISHFASAAEAGDYNYDANMDSEKENPTKDNLPESKL